jgi:hypothetical protein
MKTMTQSTQSPPPPCHADVEFCTIDDLGIEITGDGAEPIIATLNEYFRDFAKPIKRDGGGNIISGATNCLKCKSALEGMFGSFRWGLTHGEGECSQCGWPCRAYHRPKDEEGEIFNSVLPKILQYHPSVVTTKHEPESY